LDPELAVVISGVAPSTARLIDEIDGTRDAAGLRASAADLGLDDGVADQLVSLLAAAFVLDDGASDARPLAALPLVERERLAPDLASASLVSGSGDAGLSTLVERQAATVVVLGGGRLGATTATLLAAAGVGHVVVEDAVVTTAADCAPGGTGPDDVGATREQAAHRAIHRVSSSTSTDPLGGAPPDVVVLAPTGPLDIDRVDDLVRGSVPHLLTAVREVTGVVGPFVYPGASACRRCLDLHRRDRDPGWPVIAAQLSTDSRRYRPAACDVVLASQIASICAAQVLQHLDGGYPTTRNGTLEIRLPDWRVRRRSWQPHPSCGCHWPAADPTADTGE
jgi:bacteriocin biosynthesis cyclodehydratase domain-containing protein